MTAGAIELVLGALLMIGLFSRIVGLHPRRRNGVCLFHRAHFKIRAEPVFLPLINGGTAAILFCFACLYLATSGGGPISVDEMGKKS